jgi:hypothetical protein
MERVIAAAGPENLRGDLSMISAASNVLSDPYILGILLFVFSAVCVCALMSHLSLRNENKFKNNAMASSDWRPTGKIDFYCTKMPKDYDAPSAFLLRAEDCRTVKSVSGVAHTEIRWRNAVLAEAKFVVTAHQNSIDTRTPCNPLPRLVART